MTPGRKPEPQSETSHRLGIHTPSRNVVNIHSRLSRAGTTGNQPATRSIASSSMHPRTYLPTFDLLHELSQNRDHYTGEESLSIYSFPNYLRTCIDRVRARVSYLTRDTKPGLHCTISACISHGITTLTSHPSLTHLILLKTQLDLSDDISSMELEELSAWFRSFTVSTIDECGGGTTKQNVQITKTAKQAVCALASELGTTSSVISLLSIMVTLSDQPSDPPMIPLDHLEMLERAVGEFFRRAELRTRVAELLLSTK